MGNTCCRRGLASKDCLHAECGCGTLLCATACSILLLTWLKNESRLSSMSGDRRQS